jgi:hypothetical protein
MTTQHEVEAELLTAGTFEGNRRVTVSESDLDTIIANHHALAAGGMTVNAVVGHKGFSEGDAQPAVGRLVALFRRGRVLVGRFANVPTIVADAIRKKLYSSVSVEFYENIQNTPHSRLAPHARGKALSRVAWLGGTIPAVRGLRDLEVLLASEGLAPTMLEASGDDVVRVTFTHDVADEHVRRQVAWHLQQQQQKKEEKNMQQPTDLMELGARAHADVVTFAERHGFDLRDPYQRRIAEGGARDGAAAAALREYYRSPLEAKPSDVAALAEQTAALERAVVTVCRERCMDATAPADRAVALSEIIPNDARFAHLVPEYGRSSVGHDARASR